MSDITYKQATLNDIDAIAQMGKLLYSPDNSHEKLRAEADEHLRSGKWAMFLAYDEETSIGLCEISCATTMWKVPRAALLDMSRACMCHRSIVGGTSRKCCL